MSTVYQIPAQWNKRRLRFDAYLNPLKSMLDLAADTEVSFVPMDAVGEFGCLTLKETRPLQDVYNGYTYFEDGDVVVAKITPCFENGKGALAQGLTNGIAFGTTELHVIRPLSGLDARFLFYLTIAHDFRSFGEAEMLGAGGQKRVPEEFLKNWRAPLPSIEIQRRIVFFLDEKTARIDGLIEKKRALLDRLAEKRQALITNTVTKGLNPGAVMKPSGIEWFGDIPAHWDVLPLRRFARSVSTGRTPPASEGDFFSDGEINWFTPGDFGSGIELTSSIRRVVPEALQVGAVTLFPKGTVFLVSIGATLGKVAVGTEPGSANQQINAIIPECMNDPYYLAYFLHGFRNEVRVASNGNTLGILNQSGTKSLPVLRPSTEEQHEIADCLRLYDTRTAGVMQQVENSLELLGQYRATLILAAITGQLQELQ